MSFGKRTAKAVTYRNNQPQMMDGEQQCLPCRDTGIFRTRGQSIVCPHCRESRKQAAEASLLALAAAQLAPQDESCS